MLLSDEEIIMLTDYTKASAQCKQLIKMGIPFETGRTGKPKVLRDVAIKKLGGVSKAVQKAQPDFTSLILDSKEASI